MNYYSPCTAEAVLAATPAEIDLLCKSLLPEPGEHPEHGLQYEVERYARKPGGAVTGIYFFADESVTPEELPETFTNLVGAVLRRLRLPHLEFGVAYYADRRAPGACGGAAFRILASGELEYRETYWPSEYHKPRERKKGKRG